jgi:hypothetical protein
MSFDKDRYDALMTLADFRRVIRESRRIFEWRVSFIVWAALAGIAIYPHRLPFWIVSTSAFVIAALHVLWVKWNWIANDLKEF